MMADESLLWQSANRLKNAQSKMPRTQIVVYCSLGLKLKAKCRDTEDLQTAKCR